MADSADAEHAEGSELRLSSRNWQAYLPLACAAAGVLAVAVAAHGARWRAPWRAGDGHPEGPVGSLGSAWMPATGAVGGPGDEAMNRAHKAMLQRVPEGFTVVVQPPFVIAGDGSPSEVERRARTTVRWTVDKLHQDFFPKLPSQPLQIWLFASAGSYRDHTLALFGRKPSTPYGFYLDEERALIMNISTGGGTLVHEIVHPFMTANHPSCPPWLNEGLGSLFEQSADVDGRIVGLTNWRLAGLQRAIRDGHTISLDWLLEMNDAEFYGNGSGLHYAQARYLLYYLQERGLLRPFFRQALSRRATDPTAAQTLRETLQIEALAPFQRRWEAYVMRLQFPSPAPPR